MKEASIATASAFLHPALFYCGDEEYLAATVPFILEGLSGGEPVAVAVPGPKLALLRATLGGDAHRVRLLNMTEVGRNPGRIIPGVLRAFADAHQTGGCASSVNRSGRAAVRWSIPPAYSTRR